MKICIQAGHINYQYNSILSLRSSTGAPNEYSFNQDIANQVSGELRKRGFEVKQTDANANDDKSVTSTDWDLFLAIHYDADIYNTGGGFVDYADPSVDSATAQSQRIAGCIREKYFATTKIVNHPERSNVNTRFYYMWKYLTAKTPCVIIECGVGMHVPDDWQVLHFSRLLVVEGLVRGVCGAFNVNYDLPVVIPPTTPVPEPIPNPFEDKVKKIYEIVWGKGWPWTKINKIKEILPK
jgi:N-acetylmuramoyl-L-alanine amidase